MYRLRIFRQKFIIRHRRQQQDDAGRNCYGEFCVTPAYQTDDKLTQYGTVRNLPQSLNPDILL